MSTWSSRRKFGYGSIVVICFILVVGVPLFLTFYKAPTCTDKIMNGSETGVDCGGSCVRLCQSSFLPPYVAWGGAKFEKVANGLYNLAALIENQNINGAALNVPYRITLFDAEGIMILEKTGTVSLFAHRNSLAFEPAVNVGKRTPAKATFEFTASPNWFKSHDTLGGIAIADKKYLESETDSSLEITLENTTLFPYNNVLVSVVLYDKDGNAIGFSQTKIDSIPAKNGKEVAPFTWSVSRKGQMTSIEVIPIINPAVDR